MKITQPVNVIIEHLPNHEVLNPILEKDIKMLVMLQVDDQLQNAIVRDGICMRYIHHLKNSQTEY